MKFKKQIWFYPIPHLTLADSMNILIVSVWFFDDSFEIRQLSKSKSEILHDLDNFMRWLSYSIMAVIIISLFTAASYAQSPSTYSVVDPVSGKSYPVNYSLTGGTVKEMSLDTNTTSLVLSLQTTNDGNLTITLPRTVIDAKAGANDDQFFVLVDGADTNFQESKTDTDRTLSIPIVVGTEKVEIIGTQVVPEFGPLSYSILLISIISIVIITAKTRSRLKF